MPATLKGRLPWRLGAPSYVTPGDIVSNVRLLAPLVDDVQLLFFESSANERLNQAVPCNELQELAREHHLTFTAHLPTDIRLGADEPAVRQQAITEVIQRVESLATLDIGSFDLHLQMEAMPPDRWLGNLDAALEMLAGGLGERLAQRVAIENIDYPLALILPLLRAHGFSLCLDLGHVMHYGHDLSEALVLIAATRHIHLHGIADGRDHQALVAENDYGADLLAQTFSLTDFQGVVTLEIYEINRLHASLAFLYKSWADWVR